MMHSDLLRAATINRPLVKWGHCWCTLIISKEKKKTWLSLDQLHACPFKCLICYKFQPKIPQFIINTVQEASLSSLGTKRHQSLFPRGSQIDFARLISEVFVISCSLCKSRTNISSLHSSPVSQRAMGSCFYPRTFFSLRLDMAASAVSVGPPAAAPWWCKPWVLIGWRGKDIGVNLCLQKGSIFSNQRWEVM